VEDLIGRPRPLLEPQLRGLSAEHLHQLGREDTRPWVLDSVAAELGRRPKVAPEPVAVAEPPDEPVVLSPQDTPDGEPPAPEPIPPMAMVDEGAHSHGLVVTGQGEVDVVEEDLTGATPGVPPVAKSKPRGFCPVCGAEGARLQSGAIRQHLKALPSRSKCEGSGRPALNAPPAADTAPLSPPLAAADIPEERCDVGDDDPVSGLDLDVGDDGPAWEPSGGADPTPYTPLGAKVTQSADARREHDVRRPIADEVPPADPSGAPPWDAETELAAWLAAFPARARQARVLGITLSITIDNRHT